MRGKGREERGPKKHSKNSDNGTPLIQVLFSGLPIETGPSTPGKQTPPKNHHPTETVC